MAAKPHGPTDGRGCCGERTCPHPDGARQDTGVTSRGRAGPGRAPPENGGCRCLLARTSAAGAGPGMAAPAAGEVCRFAFAFAFGRAPREGKGGKRRGREGAAELSRGARRSHPPPRVPPNPKMQDRRAGDPFQRPGRQRRASGPQPGPVPRVTSEQRSGGLGAEGGGLLLALD